MNHQQVHVFNCFGLTEPAPIQLEKVICSGGRLMKRWNGRRLWLFISLLPILFFFSSVGLAEESSFKIISYRPVFDIKDLLRLPSDVAVDRQGRIFILDGTADLVRAYDRHGKPLFTLGGKTILDQPIGIDVSVDGDVLVADSGNHRLTLFPAGEKTPLFINIPPPSGGKPSDPTDVLFSSHEGTFLAVDNENHRVVSIDKSGNLLWSQGTMGRNPGEFRFPFLFDMDSEGNMYVVEVINTRVQVIGPTGDHVRFIGDWGIEPGQFFRPKGIAVNDEDEVFVSDSYLGVIQIFSRQGVFLGAVGDEQGNLKKFITPVGMALSENRLLVIEMFNNRLVVMEKVH